MKGAAAESVVSGLLALGVMRTAQKPRLIGHLVVCLFCVSSIIPTSRGQTSALTFTIYGTVRMPDGSPASRVVVQLSSQTGPPLEVFTNDFGRYEIANIPRGRYALAAVNRAAPEMFSDPVEVETGRTSPARILANIYLRASPQAQPRKPEAGASITLTEAVQQVPKPARKAFDQARRFRSEKQLDKALDCLNRSIDLFPGYFQAYAERGHLRIALMQPAEAAADFARSLELNDRYEPALRGTGICRFQNGNFEEARGYFERALSVAPGSAVDHLFLGICLLQLDRRDGARASLQKALGIDPAGTARAHVHLATLWIKEKRPDEAIAELEAYLAAVPDAADADSQRSMIARLRAERSRR